MQIILKLQKENQPVYTNIHIDTEEDQDNLEERLQLEYEHLDAERLSVSKLLLTMPEVDYMTEPLTATIYLSALNLPITYELPTSYKQEELYDLITNLLEALDLGTDYPTLEDYKNQLQDIEGLEFADWQPFNEDFFKVFFTDPYEAARATHFGDVNWDDGYIRFDVYGNLETTRDIDLAYEVDEIMNQFLVENLWVQNHGLKSS